MGGNISVKRSGRRRGRAPMAEINMTPFIDVMLVLLIIFMVAAPMLTVGVPIDLPESRAPNLPNQTKPVSITVQNDGKIFVQDVEVTQETLLQALENNVALQGTPSPEEKPRILIRGDKDLNYGLMMQVMGMVASSGYTKIGLVTLQQR